MLYLLDVNCAFILMLSANQIANVLGYNSAQYFIRIFREKYGYTPKVYQKIHLATAIDETHESTIKGHDD